MTQKFGYKILNLTALGHKGEEMKFAIETSRNLRAFLTPISHKCEK